ncbi:hypothetical protein BGZ83_011973 [Gryganskiella cystojenkinii]|nr:hypothetical protein BGZ83_011973 [Gryganskiella cystojenkinii]
MSEAGNIAQGQNQGRRTPKVGVYVPRHRRGGAAAGGGVGSNHNSNTSSTSSPASDSAESERNSGTSSPLHRGNSDDGSSTRSGNSSASEVQRRGRGKFTAPGGGSSGSGGNSNSGSSNNGRRNTRDGRGGHSSNHASPQQQQQPQQPLPRHAPRGRDFDATVLRRYSDDENRPGSSFSRSNSYNTTRSSNNNSANQGVSTNNNNNDNASRNRSDVRSWRRDDSVPSPVDDSGLSDQLDRLNVSGTDDQPIKSNPESSEELEDWELAAQQSDDDSISQIAAPKPKHAERPHPAESLIGGSPSPRISKIGNWSDVVNDDMYILELYDFSAMIKTVHLTDMFAPYENRSGGFRIKWVDDTKALVIFESAAVAKQAYAANVNNQIAKIKPYTGADKDTIRNEGKPSSGAYNGLRPAKTDSVARRLIQGALGVRVRRTPEQIAEEKALVQAAKDARNAQREEERRQRESADAVFNS